MERRAGLAGLLALVTARPVAVTMIVVAAAVFGWVSFGKLRVDLLPEIGYPTLTVRTTWTGAAPEDVEDRVSERIQESLSTLPRLVRVSSVSRAETSDVNLEFEWGTPMTFAVQDVRDRLDTLFLPPGASKPIILRYDPNLDPVLRIAVSLADDARARVVGSETDPARQKQKELVHLRWLAEQRIQRELETLPGVAAVQVRGGLVEEIKVRVDPFRMAAQNLDPRTLGERLAQENLNASGGFIREGATEYLVRTLNEFRTVDEIADLALVRRGGAAIRVRDLATVERTHAEREVVTRVDGREAVELSIYREAGANIVAVADVVLARVFGTTAERQTVQRAAEQGGTVGGAAPAYLAHALRKDARFETLSDQSTFIRDSIQDVQSAAWLGVLLTVFVIRLALRAFAPTLIISVSIPISVVVTFVPMFLAGVSLNIMSLGGLALGIGMVVDASIVVLEAIQRRRDAGDGAITAAVNGAGEVAGAIAGSTLTSVAVFAPIVFVHGIAGRIFGDQALTVVSSLCVSLLVAGFFIPMLASRSFAGLSDGAARPALRESARGARASAGGCLLAAGRLAAWAFGGVARLLVGLGRGSLRLLNVLLWPAQALHDRAWRAVDAAYPRLLSAALARPWIPLLAAVLLGAISAQRARGLGFDLLPDVHQGEFTFLVGLPVGSRLEATDEALQEIERAVRQIPGVARTALVVGVEKDALTREIEGRHTARLTVRLERELANERDENRLVAAVRACVERHPAIRTVSPPSRPTPFAIEAPIEVEVLGYDLEAMRLVADEVAARLARVEGLEDVRTSVRPGHPEARLAFDRDKLLEYGLDLSAVSALVREQVLGTVSTRFRDGEERIDVRVLGDEFVRNDLVRVMDLVVNPTATVPVRLADVAEVHNVEGPAEIRRIGNTRAILVSAAVAGLDLGGVSARVDRSLSDLGTPDDVVVQLGGRKRELDDARANLIFALCLALFLVYAVMASQFESLVQPLIVLLTVPLAGVGVIWALSWLSMPISVVVFIGLILLAGIVVNNAIVLVVRVNQTRADGLAVREALLEACRTRLRPIYMTTATTVLGMLPLTGWLAALPGLSGGAGAELRAPMAVTVIAGLLCSALLTLFVIPCAYRLVLGGRLSEAPR
ncbi:MAG: efflux RND transporter permease subunit [Planctomycetes bacterium]|nr:efflux RND transporter permease subunit [Planctomycetota bacterium]